MRVGWARMKLVLKSLVPINKVSLNAASDSLLVLIWSLEVMDSASKIRYPPLKTWESTSSYCNLNLSWHLGLLLHLCNSTESQTCFPQSFQFLSKNLTQHWREVGRTLGIQEDKLRAIREDSSSIQDAIYNMFNHWKQKNGSNISFAALMDALVKEDRKDLADTLKRRKGVKMSYCVGFLLHFQYFIRVWYWNLTS